VRERRDLSLELVLLRGVDSHFGGWDAAQHDLGARRVLQRLDIVLHLVAHV